MPDASGSVAVGGVRESADEFPQSINFWTETPEPPWDWSWWSNPAAVSGDLFGHVHFDLSQDVPDNDPMIRTVPPHPGTAGLYPDRPITFEFDCKLTGLGAPWWNGRQQGAEAMLDICDEDIRAGLSAIGNVGGVYMGLAVPAGGGAARIEWFIWLWSTDGYTYAEGTTANWGEDSLAAYGSGELFHVRLRVWRNGLEATIAGETQRLICGPASYYREPGNPHMYRGPWPRLAAFGFHCYADPGEPISADMYNLTVDGGWDEFGGQSGILIDDFDHVRGDTSGLGKGWGYTYAGAKWRLPTGWGPSHPPPYVHPSQPEFEAAWEAETIVAEMGPLGENPPYEITDRAAGTSGPEMNGWTRYPESEEGGGEPNQCIRIVDATGSPLNLWDLITEENPFFDLTMRFVWSGSPRGYHVPVFAVYLCNTPSIANGYVFAPGGPNTGEANMVQYIGTEFWFDSTLGVNKGGCINTIWPYAPRFWYSDNVTPGGSPSNEKVPMMRWCGPEVALTATMRFGKDFVSGKPFMYAAVWNTDSAPHGFDAEVDGTAGAIASAGDPLIGFNDQAVYELKYLEFQLQIDDDTELEIDEIHLIPGGTIPGGSLYALTGSIR